MRHILFVRTIIPNSKGHILSHKCYHLRTRNETKIFIRVNEFNKTSITIQKNVLSTFTHSGFSLFMRSASINVVYTFPRALLKDLVLIIS